MTDMQDLFEPKQIKAKKGLFEVVQAVATELGKYNSSIEQWKGTYSFFNYLDPDRKYVFQRQGLKAIVEFDCKVDDDMRYFVPAAVKVEVNGNIVFHEVKCLGGYIATRPKPVVQAYEPGAWEKQIWKLYEDALHLKAAKQARIDILKQKIKAAGSRRSASIW